MLQVNILGIKKDLKTKFLANYDFLLRYSGAGDELISPVYIAPTLPPYVERTWPDDEVSVWMMKIMIMMMMMHDDNYDDDDEDV